ncbi:hypothetical protein H4Q26_015201 [Puccinia striiformis f. sp. tritici PST-130]|uniref:TFIIE beta domain-containing protein n=2 Tax=Puccinia striiformis f. sp. tritici TaxID=168172 RepID=A0A0L0VN73_9BASI|nr:hypothetical protein Pst134EB_018169 [Puccinia striiformis f. sp. tritici]KAI9622520.1 hypothetical protein H4Q26_015201 [Puccinia striiformis f. sp. tritici PST-130]KNF00738.1 hypothetical protein PSTG_06152 [Puccinia striiformis f. sp. tritici PST-78]
MAEFGGKYRVTRSSHSRPDPRVKKTKPVPDPANLGPAKLKKGKPPKLFTAINMSTKFPSLPAPRFAPPKPSPLSQSAATPPPEEIQQPQQPAINPPSSSILSATTKPKKGKKPNKQTAASVVDNSGPGKQFATQVFKLVDALKQNNGPMNLSDLEAQTGVRGLLSEHTDVPFNQELYDAFNSHDRVNAIEKGFVRLWSYRPDYIISNPQEVLELLKRFSTTRGGMPYASLKSSWPGVMSAIIELENEGKILVLRTEGVGGKEGNTVKTVFYDELGCRENLGPSRGALDPDFREMWHSLQTPPVHSLPIELQEAGLTSTTSNNPKPTNSNRKIKKKSGKGGKVKITNTHLKDLGIDLSKDYLPNKK